MKKEHLSAVAAALVVGLILLLVLLPSDGTPPETTGPILPGSTASTAAPTRPYIPPTTVIVVTPTGTSIVTSPPPPTTTLPPAPGVVRLYTCDPALLAVYVELAAEYYAETGTEVIVQAPQEGQSCEEALTALLAEDNAPTLFCIHSQQMLESLQNDLYDLSGTQAAQQLYGDAFALNVDGKMLALAANVEGSGLIYNASKLANAAWTDEDLVDFSALSVAVSNITSNKGYAFTAPDFSDTHLMEHLAGLFDDGEQLRSFVDLYFKNSTSKTTTLTYFLNGTTVFYIGGTRDYGKVAALGDHNLRFIPAYAPGSTAVQCFSDHYWAVSNTASDVDIQATVDFLGWLVSEQDGAVPVDRLGLLSPYRGAEFTADSLQRQLRKYLASGDARMSWTVSGNVTDLEAFTAALKAYKTSATDANWAAVAATLGEESES